MTEYTMDRFYGCKQDVNNWQQSQPSTLNLDPSYTAVSRPPCCLVVKISIHFVSAYSDTRLDLLINVINEVL